MLIEEPSTLHPLHLSLFHRNVSIMKRHDERKHKRGTILKGEMIDRKWIEVMMTAEIERFIACSL